MEICCHSKVVNGKLSKKETHRGWGGGGLSLLSPTVTGVMAYDVNVTS